jgi:hypothetical protein
MKEIIACCGLACTTCEAYLATQHNDATKKQEIAGRWSQQFKMDIKAEDITCDSCREAAGRHSGYCRACEIRKCCDSRNLQNCAFCPDYACGKLSQFHGMAPEAQQRLDRLHAQQS